MGIEQFQVWVRLITSIILKFAKTSFYTGRLLLPAIKDVQKLQQILKKYIFDSAFKRPVDRSINGTAENVQPRLIDSQEEPVLCVIDEITDVTNVRN